MTRELLISFLRESTTKETYAGSPYVVKQHLVAEYGLCTDMPEDLVPAYETFQGRLAEKDAIVQRRLQAEKRKAERESGGADKTVAKKKQKKPDKPKVQYPIEDTELTKADRKDEVGAPALPRRPRPRAPSRGSCRCKTRILAVA